MQIVSLGDNLYVMPKPILLKKNKKKKKKKAKFYRFVVCCICHVENGKN